MSDDYEDHEVNRLMNSVGMEALYAKDKVFSLGYIDNQYSVTLIDYADKTKIVDKFDNPDDARANFKKLSAINPDRDYDADFDQFMLAVEDNKSFHNIN